MAFFKIRNMKNGNVDSTPVFKLKKQIRFCVPGLQSLIKKYYLSIVIFRSPIKDLLQHCLMDCKGKYTVRFSPHSQRGANQNWINWCLECENTHDAN